MKKVLSILIVLIVSFCAFAEHRLTLSGIPYSKSMAGSAKIAVNDDELEAFYGQSKYGTGFKLRYEYKKPDKNFTVGADLNFKFYKNIKFEKWINNLVNLSPDLELEDELSAEDYAEGEKVLSEIGLYHKNWSELDLLANLGWNWNTEWEYANVGGFFKMGLGCSWILKPGKNVFSFVPINLDGGITYNMTENINLDFGLESIVFLSFSVKEEKQRAKVSFGYGVTPYIGATYRF